MKYKIVRDISVRLFLNGIDKCNTFLPYLNFHPLENTHINILFHFRPNSCYLDV